MSAARPPEGANAPLGGSAPRAAGERGGLHFTWPVQALRAQLAPLLPGLDVEVAAQIDSTNTELMRRVRAGRATPMLLAAERQSAGRGRLGRAWDGGEPRMLGEEHVDMRWFTPTDAAALPALALAEYREVFAMAEAALQARASD